MRKCPLLIIIVLIAFSCYGQVDSAKFRQKFEDLKRTSLIFMSFTESFSTTNYTKGSVSAGSATSRSMSFDFRLGSEGRWQNIGKGGKNLKPILINDKIAYNELNKAYNVHLKKKRICNTLEILGYVTLVGSAIVMFIGGSDYETDGVTAPLVIGGIGVAVSFADIIIFKKRTDKHMDDFANSIQQSVITYNDNQINKIK